MRGPRRSVQLRCAIPRHARGATLIELIASIVIISIATFGLLLAITSVVGRSADPMIENQAAAIAEAYLEEATLVSFCDPDFLAATATGRCRTECTSNVCQGGCGARAVHQEASRSLYDDVCDFDVISNAVVSDRLGAPIADLAGYRVSVNVVDSGVTIGPAGSVISANSGQTVRVDVSVSHGALEENVELSTFRANTQ